VTAPRPVRDGRHTRTVSSITDTAGPGQGEKVCDRIPLSTLDAFLARIRSERVAQGLPEQVEDTAALDTVATVLDHAIQARPPAA
jgi:hypothetical protein